MHQCLFALDWNCLLAHATPHTHTHTCRRCARIIEIAFDCMRLTFLLIRWILIGAINLCTHNQTRLRRLCSRVRPYVLRWIATWINHSIHICLCALPSSATFRWHEIWWRLECSDKRNLQRIVETAPRPDIWWVFQIFSIRTSIESSRNAQTHTEQCYVENAFYPKSSKY